MIQPIDAVDFTNRIKQRANPSPVAPENELVSARIPHAKGVLPAQVVEHLLAVFFPQVRDQFRVRVGAEDVAFGLKCLPFFGVVKQLTVEDGPQSAVVATAVCGWLF